MLLPLQRDIIYGPVRSRRLGRSLGLNVLPLDRKLCSLDCVYCQYGWTPREDGRARPRPLPSPAEIEVALAAALAAAGEPPAYITFSGNGEATLHPAFAEIVEIVRALRAEHAPGAKIAILSNSTTVGDAAVRAALARVDVRLMKLDAGSEDAFARINRPEPGLTLAAVIAGLRLLPEITIQAMFCSGPGGNDGDDDVNAWATVVRGLGPSAVQVYSIDRGYPGRDIERTPLERLAAIAASLDGSGIPVQTY
jgi:wyosine [tRNA(Phe)-imidazoG37] synthetase (radical SAM superfamily)